MSSPCPHPLAAASPRHRDCSLILAPLPLRLHPCPPVPALLPGASGVPVPVFSCTHVPDPLLSVPVPLSLRLHLACVPHTNFPIPLSGYQSPHSHAPAFLSPCPALLPVTWPLLRTHVPVPTSSAQTVVRLLSLRPRFGCVCGVHSVASNVTSSRSCLRAHIMCHKGRNAMATSTAGGARTKRAVSHFQANAALMRARCHSRKERPPSPPAQLSIDIRLERNQSRGGGMRDGKKVDVVPLVYSSKCECSQQPD